MKKLSIKKRVTVWYTALMCLVVALTLVFMLFVNESLLETQTQKRLVKAVENNVDEIEYQFGVLEIEPDFYFVYDEVYSLVYDGNKKLVDGYFPSGFTTDREFSNGEISVEKIEGEIYYIYDRLLTPVEYEFDGEVWVRGIVLAEKNDSLAGSMVTFSFVIFPILVLITVAGGLLISKKAFAPVREISATVNEINEGGDLSRRIDLTGRKDEIYDLAETFDKMLERLEKSFESEKQFTSDASHELRTPVSVILAECEYALDGKKSDEDYVESLETVNRQAAKMSALISGLLNFTRLEQGTQKLSLEQADLSELVLSVCEELEMTDSKNIKLITEVDNGIIAEADISLMIRLMTNLVSNAYKYGKENGTVRVLLHRENGGIAFSVQDDGIGIEKDELDKIWQRFYRSDKARSPDGSLGLGLSMVKQIAELHGGRVSVESEVGKGSTFKFFLPDAGTK